MIPRLNLYFFIIGLALLLPTTVEAQSNTHCTNKISGKIIDASSQEPIPFATIQIQNLPRGYLSDAQGAFTIENLCEEEFDITISHLGYKKFIHHHDIYHPELIIQLAPDDMILESVVIEGSTVDSGIQTITESTLSGKELELLKNESLGDMLANITGVSTLKTGQNVVKPMIHGLHGNRILIINNGLRHQGQGWGREHAPEIDASLADNVSVVKGAASVRYGPDALGGVIIINPPKLELSTAHVHGAAGVSMASNGRAINGDLLLQEGYKKFAWMVQAAGKYQGDLSTPDYILTNTGARETSYAAGLRYHLKKLDVNLHYNHIAQTFGVLRGSVVGSLEDLGQALESDEPYFTEAFNYDINNPRQEISHDIITLQSTYNFPQSRLDVRYGLQLNKRQEYDVRRGSNNQRPAIDLELSTHTLDIDWQHKPLANWNGTWGLQWLYSDNNNLPGTNTIPFVPNYNNNRFGLYAIETKTIGNTELEIGIRYDRQSNAVRGRDANNNVFIHQLNYQSMTGLVGVSTKLSPNTTFKSNLGSAWRPPDIAELYSYGKHEFTINYGLWRYETDEFGTTNSLPYVLRPDQRSVDNELGLKFVNTLNHTREGQSVEATVYANYIKGYIFSKPSGIASTVRGPFPFYVYDQTNALFYGADISYILEHSPAFTSHFKGSYIRAYDVVNEDNFVSIPANRLGYKLSFTKALAGIESLDIHLSVDYTFRQYHAPRVITIEEINTANQNGRNLFINDQSNFDFVAAPDGYVLLGLNVQTTFNQFIIGLELSNLLNQTYREYTNSMRYFADEMGINAKISARYKF